MDGTTKPSGLKKSHKTRSKKHHYVKGVYQPQRVYRDEREEAQDEEEYYSSFSIHDQDKLIPADIEPAENFNASLELPD